MALEMKKLSKEEMERALQLLERENKYKERVKKGEIKGSKKWSEYTEEEKAAYRAKEARRVAKQKVLMEKAIAAGITVSDKEIDQYLAKKQK